ncbi:hypothetical protein [Aquipuribacter hungaricus]|uniref:Uncharacterized protein n=1 Tax=Aquipuribacter hungaricus TaxID=545624 RepID=A0ABV7WFH1_9MICO
MRGVRTFRVLPDGRLAPVTSRPPWTPGVNTATCDRRSITRRLPPAHDAPGVGCVCGFWACGNVAALRQTGVLGTSRVLAVVAAHGQLVPAERGFRAQHAVIEALWLSPRVPTDRRAAVARAYPAAALYTSKAAMLAEHPPTVLSSYRLPARPRASRLLWQLALLTAWTITLTVLWSFTPYPAAVTAPTPLVPTASAQVAVGVALAITHLTLATTTLLLAMHPRLWRWSPAALLPQTALLFAGQLTLDDATAWLQLGLTTTSTTVTHLLTAAVVITRLYRLDTDEH